MLDYLFTIEPEKNRKYFLKLIESLRQLQSKRFTIHDFWEESYFEIMNKQFEKLDTSVITKEILIYNIKLTYDDVIQSPMEDEKYQHEDEYERTLKALVLAPMDMYTLARLFVKFNDKPGLICNDKSTIQNVIIHSGSTHTAIYEHFLNMPFDTSANFRSVDGSRCNMCLPIPEEFDFWS